MVTNLYVSIGMVMARRLIKVVFVIVVVMASEETQMMVKQRRTLPSWRIDTIRQRWLCAFEQSEK